MKTSMRSVIYLALALLSINRIAFADDEMMPPQTETKGEAFQRGVENVRGRGNQQGWDTFERWGALLFGDKTPDPLASSEEAARTQEINTGVGDRAQTASEFTQAATGVVTAATPSPNTVSQVGTMVVSEGTSAIVEAQTNPPQEPGTLGKIWNWIKSWF
ncbi:MAG: hypothetical protein HYS55_05250 [Candidatus Omnitrophica bacterium]|nr:hypothetical protein [Candidatus Omnitrophota bacterium]